MFIMKNFISFVFIILFYGTISAQVIGQALLFDGITDYVSFGSPAIFDIDTAVTYEVWIRPDTTSGFIFNKWVNFQEDKQMTYSGDKVTFYMHNVFSGVSLVSVSSVLLHQYTHVAATYDGSTAKLYINGVLDTSKSVGSTVSNRQVFFISRITLTGLITNLLLKESWTNSVSGILQGQNLKSNHL